MTVVVDTTTVDPRERFDFWVACAQDIFFPLGFRRAGDDSGPFHGLVRHYVLGPLTLTQVVTEPTTITRTRAEISAYDPETIMFSYIRRGSMVFNQNGRDTRVSAGEIFIQDPSAPMVMRTPRDTEQLVLAAPKSLFGREVLWATRNAGDLISPELTRTLLAPLIGSLTDGLIAGSVSTGNAPVGEGVLDLMRAACRERTDLDAAPACARVVSVKRYIDEHIGDASLCPGTVAAANFMSVRTLQKLFQDEGFTVSDWIRERRLAGARRDLLDPRLGDVPIAQIADAWGLPNPGHFSRLFRTTFGESPRDCRNGALPG